MDWDADPELITLRKEFMISVQERVKALGNQRQKLLALKDTEEPSEDLIQAIYFLVHKLAGSAGSYGFPSVGRIAELLDDLFSFSVLNIPRPDLIQWLSVLESALEEVIQDQVDPVKYLEDPRVAALISFVESLPDSTNS